MMQKITLGKTGMEISVIGFGGIAIQNLSGKQAKDLVEEALNAGITFFDTAQGYGDSEVKIGEGIRKRRKEVVLATKSPCRSTKQARSHVEQALQRLKTDWIDLYQLHHVSKKNELKQILAPRGALEGLVQLKREGKIRHIGITGHNADILEKSLKESEKLETVQFPFNIIEDGKKERSLLKIAKRLNIGTIAMKPLAGGVIPEPELSLRWILGQGVDTAIPGMILSSEVTMNSKVGHTFQPLSEQELSKLRAGVEPLKSNFCRRCMYCTPCPNEIPIYFIQELGDKVKVAAVREMRQEMYARLEKNIEDCTECGECEEKCPYNLPIRDMLKEKHHLLVKNRSTL